MAERAYAYDPVGAADGPLEERSVNNQSYRMEEGQKWRQYVVAGIANIGIFGTGLSMGWTSPIQTKLEDLAQSPLDRVVTADEMSWIGSIITLGAVLGPFIAGVLTTSVGRKWTILLTAIPTILGWILVATTVNIFMIYAARFLWGIAVGMLYMATPMYCAEISTDDVRGALGSFLQIFVVIGFLAIYSVGPFVSFEATAYFSIAWAFVFIGLFFFMPESPYYYIMKGNREGAVRSLQKVRGKSEAGVQAEVDKLQAEIEEMTQQKAKLSDLWTSIGNIKGLYISCGLVAFQQFSGINVVLFYMSNIFSAAGTTLDPAYATIIVGAVQVVSSCITPFVVDRLGRKLLLFISSAGMSVSLGLLGMYFILDTNKSPIMESIGFLPIAALVIYIIVYCIGFGPLPWAVMGELFPLNIKSVASPIATAFCWILAFFLTRFFQNIADAIGMHGAFWVFGGFCIIAFLFTLFLVPETKGKSMQEIQDMLNNRSTPTKTVL